MKHNEEKLPYYDAYMTILSCCQCSSSEEKHQLVLWNMGPLLSCHNNAHSSLGSYLHNVHFDTCQILKWTMNKISIFKWNLLLTNYLELGAHCTQVPQDFVVYPASPIAVPLRRQLKASPCKSSCSVWVMLFCLCHFCCSLVMYGSLLTLPQLSVLRSHVLQKVCMYFTYKVRYTNSSTEIPEFPIAPEIALELLMAANFLDC